MRVGIYGLGYDEFILDYKVVGFFRGTSRLVPQVKVYTSRTDTWRRIQDFSWEKPLESGKFANEALHWSVGVSTGSNYSWVIVSLDLAKETYKEVAQPKFGDGVCRDDANHRLYGDDPGFYQYSVPLCVSMNGEILLEIRLSLELNDSKESTFRYPSIPNLHSFLEVDTYVESLVSPSADNELQESH
ncbi:F-box/kelch-repeat protein At3g23880-like [Cornus florida]|uniref:F-box/kelch-repeat protein At3g23880-like n=1 Tax=Cornus florida TaxID=4283 RepID=UPI00289A9BF7|nr:F-box/kelch-repeat protein At3g23880-like [Cornus florida]